jgi:hypothetical protein
MMLYRKTFDSVVGVPLPFLIFLATVLFLTFLHRRDPCVAGTFSRSLPVAGVPAAVCVASWCCLRPCSVTDRLVAACFLYKFLGVLVIAIATVSGAPCCCLLPS